jgi:fatty acid-binding protein DegV
VEETGELPKTAAPSFQEFIKFFDTMDYLYKGGRCTAFQAFVGSMLKIHPVIHIRQDGSLGRKYSCDHCRCDDWQPLRIKHNWDFLTSKGMIIRL